MMNKENNNQDKVVFQIRKNIAILEDFQQIFYFLHRFLREINRFVSL